MPSRTASEPWLRPLEAAAGPRYLQIVRQIETAVRDGVLRPGDRLPPQRSLAERLGVDLTTVTRAYAEARHRNLLEAVTGRGSFVSVRPLDPGPAIDLSMNIPPPPKGLRLADLLQRGISEVLARGHADLLMTYQVGPGSLADRSAACRWLEPVLGAVEPARLVISAGAQPVLVALLRMLVAPGGAVLAPQLVYPGLMAAARHCGIRVVAVAGDAAGVVPEALERAAREHGAHVLYLNPTINNPTARTMPQERREVLLAVARRLDLRIVEDDPYSLLAGDAPPPLAALAPERCYHLATLSKVLTPGLRTAFTVLPPGEACDDLVGLLRETTLMPAPLMTALACHWIRSGSAAALLAGVRTEAGERQALARAMLPPEAVAHPYGLHVWLPLPERWSRQALIRAAARERLGVTPADSFAVGSEVPEAVRISLGGAPDRDRLATALAALAAMLAEPALPRRAVV